MHWKSLRATANQSVEPEHFLAALVQDGEGIVAPLLQKIGSKRSII